MSANHDPGTPAVTLRLATPADAAALDGLLRRSYATLMAGAYSPGVLAAALPLIARGNPELLAAGTYHLAVTAGGDGGERLLGAGGWSLARPGSGEVEPGRGHIRHFAVDPDATGAGIGARLFERCRAEAARAGARDMEVYASLNAVGFYARMGFARGEAVEIPLDRHVAFSAVRMHRLL